MLRKKTHDNRRMDRKTAFDQDAYKVLWLNDPSRTNRFEHDVYLMKPIRAKRVNTGSCNGCDVEVLKLILDNVEFVDSVEDSDVVILTGPISQNMKNKVDSFVNQLSKEKRNVVAIGSCSLSGGICQESETVQPFAFKESKICIFGCPPSSETILEGIKISLGKGKKHR